MILIQVVILVAGGYLLTTYPGTLTIQWLGYNIETSLLVFFTALLIVSIILGFVLKFLAAIFHVPSFMKARYQKHTYEKGIHSLTEGISALYALDGKRTEHTAQGVRQYLHESNLATFLEAEAAYLQGDMVEAQKLYQSLMTIEEYQFLSSQGLSRIYLKLGKDQEALEWATKAKDASPNSPWAHQTIVDQAIKMNNQPLALAELNEMNNPPQKATILLQMAEEEVQGGNLQTALQYAKEAYEIAADQIEICLLYVDLLRKIKGDKTALKVIEQSWAVAPHPTLAEIYVKMLHPDSPLNKLSVIKRLASFAPQHPESFLITARAAIDAKQFNEARECLEQLIADGYQTETVLKLQADLAGFVAS